MYRILCVGGYQKDDFLTEGHGDNISEYNARINECTGLYWIWKNTRSDYVGMSHYRRWFYNRRTPHDKSRLDKDRVEELLLGEKYDIILTRTSWFPWRVIDNCNICLGEEITEKADMVFRKILKIRQPNYIRAYDEVMAGNHMHVCNLFVTRWEIFDAYCEWLFSVLLDAADWIDVSDCTARQARVAGYFAEIMPTVWLKEHDYRICEQPHRMV